MSKTERLTGINLKAMPMGESDRLLTILSPEQGLLRLIAPGARKQNSRLGGRSSLFVVNDLIVATGRSMAKITQAETLESYPGLSRDLARLTCGQYLAEMALHQALGEQPQADLYYLLTEHLHRIEQAEVGMVLPCLVQAVYQLLALAGVAPQVQQCCISNQVLEPDLDAVDEAGCQVGFSIEAGGAISLAALAQQLSDLAAKTQAAADGHLDERDVDLVREAVGEYRLVNLNQLPTRPRRQQSRSRPTPQLMIGVTAIELYLMQQLAQEALPQLSDNTGFTSETILGAWRNIERILRQYAQFHFDRAIRSATLIDGCFV
jgi:DNA repair protein RecO (recombination protein O)